MIAQCDTITGNVATYRYCAVCNLLSITRNTKVMIKS